MEANADFYRTLGVAADADSAAIRLAYRNLMRRYHPDVNQSEDAAAKATAINEAYACLGDDERRAAYDLLRRPQAASRTYAGASRHQPRRNAQFYQQRSFATELDLPPPSTKWKVASLTLALVVTIVTFTLTSATPPPVPPPPVDLVEVPLSPVQASEPHPAQTR